MKKIITIISLFTLLSTVLFSQKKANLESIKLGNMAPEIELLTVDGEVFHLSQVKGKLVLINFWASWCAPCRKKTPELLKVYKKYENTFFNEGEKGFEIVSVSLDRNENDWKNSIEKDGSGDFLNVGDMKGWKCTAAETYNIKTIPSSVLIDGEGKIIAINLNPSDLKKKLKRRKHRDRNWF